MAATSMILQDAETQGLSVSLNLANTELSSLKTKLGECQTELEQCKVHDATLSLHYLPVAPVIRTKIYESWHSNLRLNMQRASAICRRNSFSS